jgi:hypothetical protein
MTNDKCETRGCRQLAATSAFLLTTNKGFREVWLCLWCWLAKAGKGEA